jgi:hypothetical protein
LHGAAGDAESPGVFAATGAWLFDEQAQQFDVEVVSVGCHLALCPSFWFGEIDPVAQDMSFALDGWVTSRLP